MTTYEQLEKLWEPDPAWTIGGNGKKCRQPRCGKDAVATLMRAHGFGSEGRPWAYCGDHLYGRRIRNGVVEWEGVKQ